jgi:hypothetical protein
MKKYAIPFFLLGSLVMIYVMAKTGAPLKTPATPNGILNLEFAYNTTRTDIVTGAWSVTDPVDLIAAAKFNTGLDFIFIFFYSIFLFLASKKMSKLFGGGFGKSGKIIARGALLAGFLDVLENTGMLITLSGHGSGTISFMTSTCSIIKWILAIMAVLYVLTGTVALLRRRLKN